MVVPGANGQLTPELLEKAAPLLEGAGFLLAQLEIPVETVEYLAQFAEGHGIPLMLDPAPAREFPRSCFAGSPGLRQTKLKPQRYLESAPRTATKTPMPWQSSF